MSLGSRLRASGGKLPEPLVCRPALLLSPNTPRPMHGLAPRVLLGTKWWYATRKAAYASTGQRCLACGTHKASARGRAWLEAHESYTVDYVKGIWKYVEAVPLCHYCHAYIHSGRIAMLLEKGEIHQSKYVGIIQHGDRVLAAAGLTKQPPYDGPCAAWSKWRLWIGRKRYKSLFKDFDDWAKHHQ